VVSLVMRWRRGSGEVRQQLVWLMLAVVLVLVLVVCDVGLSPWSPAWLRPLAEILVIVCAAGGYGGGRVSGAPIRRRLTLHPA
jgi:protein-S-isoprenylcysteine O-methyltransferase Ste14